MAVAPARTTRTTERADRTPPVQLVTQLSSVVPQAPAPHRDADTSGSATRKGRGGRGVGDTSLGVDALSGSVPPLALWACSAGVGGRASVSFNWSTSERPRLLSLVDSRLSAPVCGATLAVTE